MKIKITESQYNRLFLKEEKEINFNFDIDTILGFAKLIGLPLKGQNEFLANKLFNLWSIRHCEYGIKKSGPSPYKSEDYIDIKNDFLKIYAK